MLQYRRQLLERVDGRVPLTAFQISDISALDLSSIRKVVLRHTLFDA